MSDPLAGVPLTRRAERDLEKILKRNRLEFLRLWDDLRRWTRGDLPPQGTKKLRGFTDLYQFDSGRYRVVHSGLASDQPGTIIRVLPKPEQARAFRRLR